jgi:DNA-binding NtrC family response regulator
MVHRLLVIEAVAPRPEADVRAALAGDGAFHCRSLSWDALAERAAWGKEAEAVVAVAVPPTPQATAAFRSLRKLLVETPVIAVLPGDVEEQLLEAATQTVDDFVVSPIRPTELRYRLQRLLSGAPGDRGAVRERLLAELGLTQLVGRDPAFADAVRQIPRLARSEAPVLITGETGTGKELCARAIHFLSHRRGLPFVAIDCGALPEHLIENELFGHARGAYTDAHREQPGLIATADGGTLLLDEVDALSMTAQAKLLRFLQDRTFRPIGSNRLVCADVRVVSATNQDLDVHVRARRFRSDLYFRLDVLRVHLPSLGERPDDVGLLAAHFLDEYRAAHADAPRGISRAALRMLMAHDWPGNVRELQNVVQRAAVACDEPQILPRHIALLSAAWPSTPTTHFRTARAAVLANFERSYVEELLQRHQGNITRAARVAGKDRRAFGRLVKKYNIRNRPS